GSTIQEYDDIEPLVGTRSADGDHFESDFAATPIRLDAHSLLAHSRALFPCLANGRAQIDQEPFARHFRQTKRGMAQRRLEIIPGSAPELHNLHLFVDDDAGRNETAGEHAFDLFFHREPGFWFRQLHLTCTAK